MSDTYLSETLERVERAMTWLALFVTRSAICMTKRSTLAVWTLLANGATTATFLDNRIQTTSTLPNFLYLSPRKINEFFLFNFFRQTLRSRRSSVSAATKLRDCKMRNWVWFSVTEIFFVIHRIHISFWASPAPSGRVQWALSSGIKRLER